MRFKFPKKVSGFVADAAKGGFKATGDVLTKTKGAIEDAIQKTMKVEGIAKQFEVDSIVKKTDGDYIVFKKGGEIKASEFNDLMNGNVLKQTVPDMAGLYKRFAKNIDDITADTLKKADDKAADSMKKTSAWKNTTDVLETNKTAKKLSDTIDIPPGATKADITDALKKAGKLDEFAEFASKSKTRSRFGTFLKGTVAVGAILTIDSLIDAIQRHQDNINGCWISNVDDPENQSYKILRNGETCEAAYGCRAVKFYDSMTSQAVNPETGYLKGDEYGFPGNILLSPCAPGPLSSINELCCERDDPNIGGKCGLNNNNRSCTFDPDNIFEGDFGGVKCSIPADGSQTCGMELTQMFSASPKTVCPNDFAKRVKYEYQDQVLVDISNSVSCDEQICSESNFTIMHVEGDKREWVIQCKKYEFLDAAADFMGVDGLTAEIGGFFDNVFNVAKIVIYVIIGLWALGLIWFIVSNFIMPLFDSSWGDDTKQIIVKIEQPSSGSGSVDSIE